MLKKKISLDKREKYKYFKESVYCQTFYYDLKKKKGLKRLVKKFNLSNRFFILIQAHKT